MLINIEMEFLLYLLYKTTFSKEFVKALSNYPTRKAHDLSRFQRKWRGGRGIIGLSFLSRGKISKHVCTLLHHEWSTRTVSLYRVDPNQILSQDLNHPENICTWWEKIIYRNPGLCSHEEAPSKAAASDNSDSGVWENRSSQESLW